MASVGSVAIHSCASVAMHSRSTRLEHTLRATMHPFALTSGHPACRPRRRGWASSCGRESSPRWPTPWCPARQRWRCLCRQVRCCARLPSGSRQADGSLVTASACVLGRRRFMDQPRWMRVWSHARRSICGTRTPVPPLVQSPSALCTTQTCGTTGESAEAAASAGLEVVASPSMPAWPSLSRPQPHGNACDWRTE